MRHRTVAAVVGLLVFCQVCKASGLDKERLAIVRANLAKGEALVSQGEYAKAERLFRAAVEAEPMVPTSHMGLGAALVGLERFEEGLLVLEEAERRFIEWEQMIGIAELQKRQYAARQLVLIADLTASTNANTSQVSNVGTPRDLKQLNEDRVSKEQFLFRERRVLEGLHSIPAQVFYLEGIAYLRTDRPILGIEALEVCLLVDDEHGLAHYNLAVAFFGQGEYEEARTHLEAAVLAGVEPHERFEADLAAAGSR
jgi:tetratricopeptide (TPR) repeat protein